MFLLRPICWIIGHMWEGSTLGAWACERCGEMAED